MYRLRFLVACVACAYTVTGCGISTVSNNTISNSPDSNYNYFNDGLVDIGGNPSTNEYSIATFMKLPQFQAIVEQKYIDLFPRGSNSNHWFLLYISPDTNGADIVIHDEDASELLLNAVNKLQYNQVYTFPDVLRVSNTTNM